MAKRTTKKAGRKKVSKKAASKKVSKKASARQAAARKQKILSTSIEIPGGMFSKQATSQIVSLILSKHELESEVVELKGKRDIVRQGINGDETEIQNMTDSYNSKGSKADDAEFTRKLVGLLKDRNRRQKKYDAITEEISDVNSKLRTLFDDLSKVVAKEDKTGTLFEQLDIKQPEALGDAEGEQGLSTEPKLSLAK